MNPEADSLAITHLELQIWLRRIYEALSIAFQDKIAQSTGKDALKGNRRRVYETCQNPRTLAEIRAEVKTAAGGEIRAYLREMQEQKLLMVLPPADGEREERYVCLL